MQGGGQGPAAWACNYNKEKHKCTRAFVFLTSPSTPLLTWQVELQPTPSTQLMTTALHSLSRPITARCLLLLTDFGDQASNVSNSRLAMLMTYALYYNPQSHKAPWPSTCMRAEFTRYY